MSLKEKLGVEEVNRIFVDNKGPIAQLVRVADQLVPGSSPGGTTLKPSKSLTVRVFVFI